jgi:uncharacterized protein
MSGMNPSANPAPVTVLVTRRVRPGRAGEFERLMTGMREAAARFPGHLGGYLMEPEPDDPSRWRILFAFDSESHLEAWMSSAERKAWQLPIAEVTHGQTAMRMLSGLEGWFAVPVARTREPPPRWKMATVTWLGIFPLVLLLSPSIGAWLAPVHPALGVAGVTVLVVVAMTWLVMPLLARLFTGWLYPITP